MMGFLFGGNTGVSSPEELQRRRAIVDALIAGSVNDTPRTFGEGLASIGKALAGRIKDRKLSAQEGAERERAGGAFDRIVGGLMGPQSGGYNGAVSFAGPNSGVSRADPLDPRNIAGDAMAALGKDNKTAGYRASLIGTESGGNWGAQNNETGAGGKKGHFGRVQFGHARLKEAMDAGAIPQGTTPDQFMASPALQIAAENWHFGDLEKQLGDLQGSNVNGQKLDLGALVAMGHLGGAAGARKYVESGGAYNPSDSFGTSLAEYAQTHGGKSNGNITMSTAGADSAAAGQGQPDISELAGFIDNPYLPPAKRKIAEALLGKMTAVPDPMSEIDMQRAQIGLQKDQLELQQMQNPQQQIPQGVQERIYLLQQAGIDPKGPEGQEYLLTGRWGGVPVGGPEYGLQPVYGTDKDGKTILMQIGKDGTAVPTKLPEGVTPDLAVKSYEASRGGAEGKAAGEDTALYESMLSKMPGLEEVVNELDNVANDATYTWVGQVRDAASAQFGFEPGEGAKARSKYVATVDNQILPMLRDTFGAAFTVKESETLRATLGNPNKTPAEKREVLRAFIEQKRRDVAALGSRVGAGGADAPVEDNDFMKWVQP